MDARASGSAAGSRGDASGHDECSSATEAAYAPQPMPPADQGDYYTMDELRGEMKKLAWKKGDFTITPYGYLWGNTVYSTERTSPGSYTLFVQSASTTPESEFIVDARNTRLGIRRGLGRDSVVGLCPERRQGGSRFPEQRSLDGEQATIMLRHAYVEVKDEDFRLLVGQTWDVVSPLFPGC